MTPESIVLIASVGYGKSITTSEAPLISRNVASIQNEEDAIKAVLGHIKRLP